MNENNEQLIDQTPLAEEVSEKIPYEFQDYFLVKPLEAIKVTKEFTKPNPKSEEKTDKDGIEAVDFDDVITEVKEVNSDYRKGVVLKVPRSFYVDKNIGDSIKVGDIVLFSETCGKWFDLLKDSKLIRYYDIIAIEK